MKFPQCWVAALLMMVVLVIGCGSLNKDSPEWVIITGQIATLMTSIAENEEALAAGDLGKKAIIKTLRLQVTQLIRDLESLRLKPGA